MCGIDELIYVFPLRRKKCHVFYSWVPKVISLNSFISVKIFLWKRFEPTTSCVRDQNDPTGPAREKIFKFTLTHASVIYKNSLNHCLFLCFLDFIFCFGQKEKDNSWLESMRICLMRIEFRFDARSYPDINSTNTLQRRRTEIPQCTPILYINSCLKVHNAPLKPRSRDKIK